MSTKFSLAERPAQIIGALARYGLAAVWLVSGTIKLADPLGAKQSVAAYELFGPEMVNLIGTALPAIEVALGIMLLVGLFLRPVAALSALVFVIFIVGIGSAWARGLTIDCGCFGTGGENADAGPMTYSLEILRDLAFIAMAGIVVWRPFKKWALFP